MYVISVDAGTSSLRSVLFSPEGKLLYMSRRKYTPIIPREGWVEQNPRLWRAALYETLADCGRFSKENGILPGAISLTSQRSSVFPVSDKGDVLHNAIMWHDKRSIAICEKLNANQKWVYKKTGMRIDPMFSAPKMTWIRENLPDIYEKAYKLTGVHEYLLFLLSDQFVQDCSVGSRSLLLNLETLDWDEALLEIFRVERKKLCEILPVGTVCGKLGETAAHITSLPKGIPVITAGGDQQCATLGLNVTKSGQMNITSGTGAYLICISQTPILDEKMRFICNVAAEAGKYVVEAPVLTAGNAYQWFTDTFGKGEQTEAWADAQVTASPLGSNGVLVLPYFKGRGAPEWNAFARGAFYGVSLSTTAGDIGRAILEGIALELAENLRAISEFVKTGHEINVCGGLSTFNLYNQILADATGRTAIRYEDKEATARGAWMVAARTLGIFREYDHAFIASAGEATGKYLPDRGRYEQYEKLNASRNKLISALSGIYAKP